MSNQKSKLNFYNSNCIPYNMTSHPRKVVTWSSWHPLTLINPREAKHLMFKGLSCSETHSSSDQLIRCLAPSLRYYKPCNTKHNQI